MDTINPEVTTAKTGLKRMASEPKKLAVPAAQLQSNIAAAPKESTPTLKMSAFKDYTHWRAEYLVELPVGHQFEECLRPEFYAQVAHKLAANPMTNTKDRTGAKFVVVTEDNNFEAELCVTVVREKALEVKVYKEPVYYDLKEIPENDVNVARWNASLRGWDVVRKSDGAVVADGRNIKTRREAQNWMDKTLRN